MMADWTSVSRIVPPARTRSAISPNATSNASSRDFLGVEVHLPLLVVPGRLELLDQVARGDHFDSAGADKLDHAGVNPRHIRIADPRGILHRDAAPALEDMRHPGFQLLPGKVYGLRAREVVESAGLDAMHQLERLALAGTK